MPPKKYIKINGVMKMNPEYKQWKESQGGGAATTVQNSAQALPIVTNMDDHEQLNDMVVSGGGKEIPLAESTNATIEMMQEPEISVEAGMVRFCMKRGLSWIRHNDFFQFLYSHIYIYIYIYAVQLQSYPKKILYYY